MARSTRPHAPAPQCELGFACHPQAKARSYARAGYEKPWGGGRPYHNHWDLEDCRKLLPAVGEPEPILPQFDPSKVKPFDFEVDVERLIKKLLAEKTKSVSR